jgi:hypothetical protein
MQNILNCGREIFFVLIMGREHASFTRHASHSIREWHLVVSRGPELENNTTRSGPNNTISWGFGKDGKRWQRSKSLRIWSGLSESNRHLNLGKSEANGKSRTYEALSGALSSCGSSQKCLMFLRLFPRNEEYRSGSDVPYGSRVGTL